MMGSDYRGSLTIVSKQLLIPRGAALRVMESSSLENAFRVTEQNHHVHLQVLSLNLSLSATSTCLKCLQGWGLQLSTGQPFQCLTTLPTENSFLIFHPALIWHNWRPFELLLEIQALWPRQWTRQWEVAAGISVFPCRCLHECNLADDSIWSRSPLSPIPPPCHMHRLLDGEC